ncbi:MAG: Repressor CsoR of the copZA operon, partial [uncultured Arthrobacter sp.]
DPGNHHSINRRAGRRTDHARLQRGEGRVPQAPEAHRGTGPRHRPHGRRGEVLHRHPHPGGGDQQGPPRGQPGPARGPHRPLRRGCGPGVPGHGKPRPRPGQGPGGGCGHRPPAAL